MIRNRNANPNANPTPNPNPNPDPIPLNHKPGPTLGQLHWGTSSALLGLYFLHQQVPNRGGVPVYPISPISRCLIGVVSLYIPYPRSLYIPYHCISPIPYQQVPNRGGIPVYPISLYIPYPLSAGA